MPGVEGGNLEGKQARRGLGAVGEGHGPRKLGLAALSETSSRDRACCIPAGEAGLGVRRLAGEGTPAQTGRVSTGFQPCSPWQERQGLTPLPLDLRARPLAPGPAHRVPDPRACQRWAGQPGTRPGHFSLHLPGSGQRALCMADWPG